MEDARFDRFVRAVAGVTSRRGLLGIAASLPVVGTGGLLGNDAEAKRQRKRGKARERKDERDDIQDEKRKKKKVTLCLNGATIRVAKSKKKTFLKQGATAGACVPPPDCPPEPKTTTCAGKCGPQTNNCQQTVDCGSCDCPALCDECFTCEGSPGECVPEAFNTACGTGPSCSNGLAVPGDFCDGNGTCVSPSSFPCQPYLCAGDTCGNTCTDDNDCDATVAFCNSQNACTYKLPLGSTCEEDGDCISNACCGGACQECCKNSECTGGNICGPNNTCIAPCSDSNPCNASQLCIEGTCQDCTVFPFVDIDPLQTAITNADSGDTLYVCAGTYTSQVAEFEIKKSLTIIGAGDGDAGTFLSGRVGVFPDPEVENPPAPVVTLSNVRIKGQGPGVALTDSTLTMNACTVFESTKGVINTHGTLVLNNCNILDNVFNPGDGAGIVNTNGFVTLNGCLIQGNSARNGAGILTVSNPPTTDSSVTLNNGTIVRGNTATDATTPIGAGILNFNSTSTVNISPDSAVCENDPLADQCSGFPQTRCRNSC